MDLPRCLDVVKANVGLKALLIKDEGKKRFGFCSVLSLLGAGAVLMIQLPPKPPSLLLPQQDPAGGHNCSNVATGWMVFWKVEFLETVLTKCPSVCWGLEVTFVGMVGYFS